MKNKINELSDKFVELIKSEMTEDQFNEIKILNKAETNKHICHSHDFCDANQIMLNAFNEVFERDVNFEYNDDIEIINVAWSLALKL